MQTEIKTYLETPSGITYLSIFGYANRGVPGLEINGAGRLSKNIKEKVIYLSKSLSLKTQAKRFVICVDINDVGSNIDKGELKFLEFPILLMFWYLSGIIPIKKLDNCLARGWFNVRGEIFQSPYPITAKRAHWQGINPVEIKSLNIISSLESDNQFHKQIDARLLLGHLKGIKFKVDYIERDSDIPIKSFSA